MDYQNDIPDFLQDLAEASKSRGSRNFSDSALKVVNMKSQKNQGKVIIIPIDGENPGEGAIKQLNRVARVERWVEGTKKDGTPYGFSQRLWFFMDPRYYGELTEAQMRQLDRMKSKFNQVPEDKRPSIGTHQMTLIQGFLLSHVDKSNPAKTVNEKIPALLIYESKNFEKIFRNKINEMTETLGSYAWLSEMCNRDVKRKRYFSIDFYLNKEEGAGFQVSVTCGKFDEDAVKLTGGKIGLDLADMGENLIEKFQDPIKAWLGVPQDQPRWNQEYMDDIEAALNSLIRGEFNTVNRSAAQSTGEVTAPNSNEGFVAQSEEQAPIPTEVTNPNLDTADEPAF